MRSTNCSSWTQPSDRVIMLMKTDRGFGPLLCWEKEQWAVLPSLSEGGLPRGRAPAAGVVEKAELTLWDCISCPPPTSRILVASPIPGSPTPAPCVMAAGGLGEPWVTPVTLLLLGQVGTMLPLCQALPCPSPGVGVSLQSSDKAGRHQPPCL